MDTLQSALLPAAISIFIQLLFALYLDLDKVATITTRGIAEILEIKVFFRNCGLVPSLYAVYMRSV